MMDGSEAAGRALYERYRSAMNRASVRRGNFREPSWKNLKPWLKRVWIEAAS